MSGAELTQLSLARAAEMIRRRELSPLELTEACLERIDRVDAALNAFITVTREEALEEAQRAAQEIARGRYRGPLPAVSVPCGFTRAGLPVGLQLVGRWFEEGAVLRVARAYEQATEWHRRLPSVAASLSPEGF